MGASELDKERARQFKEEMEQRNRQLEYEYEQALEYNRRRLEQEAEINRIRNEMRIENAYTGLDEARRSYILTASKNLGYKLNPYNMTREQLKYWAERLERETKSFISRI